MEDNNGLVLTEEDINMLVDGPDICARITGSGQWVALSQCSRGDNHKMPCGSSPFARFALDGSGVKVVNGLLHANGANLEIYQDMDSQELIFYAAGEQIQVNVEYLPVSVNRVPPKPKALFCCVFPHPVEYDDEYRKLLLKKVMSSPVLGRALNFDNFSPFDTD